MPYSRITALGHYVPEQVITNDYLATLMDTSDEWITERTGIKERRWIDPAKDTVANMSAKATRMALERAGLKEKDIEFIVFATITPDYFSRVRGYCCNASWDLKVSVHWISAMHVRALFMPCR